jgi:hypothetical protein
MPAPQAHPPTAEPSAAEHHDEASTSATPIATAGAHQNKDHNAEPRAEDTSVAHQSPESPEKPDKPAHNADKHHQDGSAKEGPNLMKALGIFLIINGIFALFGGIAYFVYRMKKKKADNAPSSDEDDVEDNRGNEKRAA